MKQTKLFSKMAKEVSKEETSRNAQLLIRGGFVDKLMAGVYSLLPLGLRVFKKIEQIIREEMEAIGGQEVFLPTLHPKENWFKTGRWESMDDLYKLKIGNREFALAPTHEEVISPLAKKFISSYKDLPVNLFQFQNKFRKELRAKSGVLRGKEFIMKDLYSFSRSQEELDVYYEKVKKAYKRIFERCGIGDKTYLTYASGGTFSKYSHEFQALTEAGEDLIYICDKCRVAINKEILEDQKGQCPECGNTNLREEKAVEVGNIFKLGTKFSEPFDLDYLDEKGKKRMIIMGCYGIGLQRLMGTIVEIFNDDKGIIWPESVAPFKLHIISLAGSGDNPVYKKAESLYGELRTKGVETLWDDRLDKTPGEKFADADLLGIPYRIVVSEKNAKEEWLEVKKRNADRIEKMSFSALLERLEKSAGR
jgi:prolyl-tRNA synthetase